MLNAGRSADLLQADIAVTPAAEGPVNEADKQAELKAKAKAKQVCFKYVIGWHVWTARDV